ncbi:Abi family protein [Corynebacterium comes]|uniref:Abi-like protein n=1 Tax=Corynebacterium comes TaxID=2675218 RepID=A0A6B8VT20_9CORY|nr:Abi family protein [Corynebacterium comes]QGU04484.1 Abi-like protein [Corynebacterium comes]
MSPGHQPGGKIFRTYEQQIELLANRGMIVGDREHAVRLLRRINYYRLSGYWYPFRILDKNGGKRRQDDFYPGTTFDDVIDLYNFDARLRTTALETLAPIELAVRALLGHELGAIDRYAHLRPDLLGSRARKPASTDESPQYSKWIQRYQRELNQSHEDFVKHHKLEYGGRLPVWAAVEILDWGALTWLYGMSPDKVRNNVAEQCQLSAPQLESWLKALNIVRNYAAHHGRMFNRVYDLKPKLPKEPGDLGIASGRTNRLFGQLTTIQYLQRSLGLGQDQWLPEMMATYPDVTLVPLSHTGAPENWRSSTLWSPPQPRPSTPTPNRRTL